MAVLDKKFEVCEIDPKVCGAPGQRVFQMSCSQMYDKHETSLEYKKSRARRDNSVMWLYVILLTLWGPGGCDWEFPGTLEYREW
jgi:hypothetical protein